MSENDTTGGRTGTHPIVWILVGFLLAANLGLVGYLFFGGDDDEVTQPEVAVRTAEDDAEPAREPETTDTPTTSTSTAPTTTATPATTTTTPTSTTTSPTTTTTVAAPTTTLVPLDQLPPRGAVYRDGTLYLEGPVPTEAIAQQFVARASEVIGAENVVNDYIVRADAPVPTDGNVRVEQAVLFESGSAVIAPDFEPILGLGVAVMNINPQVRMVVEGHTDDVGSDELNLALSQRRADAAVAWMIANGGIDASRFSPVGKGEAEPVASNESPEGRQINRRIEVQLVDLLLPQE